MKNTIVLILFSILSVSSFSQKSEISDLLKYKWLNKRFPIDTLISYQGDTTVLFRSDKQYVISFWYVSCPPCIAEIEWLNKLKKDFSHENVEFIAISFDSKEDIEKLLKSHPFDFKLYYLSQEIISENDLTTGYPTNIIVNSNGIVTFHKSGGSSDEAKAKKIYDLLSSELKERED